MLGLWWRSMRGARVAWGLGMMLVVWVSAAAIGVVTGDIESRTYVQYWLVAGLIAGATGFLAVAFLVRWLRERKLRREVDHLSQWVKAKGWSGEWESGWTLPARGVPFTLGGEHTMLRTLRGEFSGRLAAVMHYQVQTESYLGGHHDPLNYYDFTVTAVAADADFPLTMVEPQRGASLLKSAVGLQDINLESAAFNGRWRVVGKDYRGTHEILHPRVMALLDSDEADLEAVTWDANAVMIVQSGFDANPESLARRLRLLSALAELVPPYMARGGASLLAGGDLHTFEMPKIESNWVELVLGLGASILVLAGMFSMGAPLGLRRTMLVLGLALVVPLAPYMWFRRRRLRRAWADSINSS